MMARISAWIAHRAANAWGYLALALAGFAFLASVRKSGADAERAKSLRNTVKAHEIRSEVDRDVARKDDPAVVRDLDRNGWLRD